MRSLPFLAPMLAVGVVCPLGAAAQTLPPAPLAMVQPLPGSTDADRLADAMRRLGSAPRDLDALVQAGDLSFRLGDATAAAAFFKRAETVNSSDPRVKAGIGRILVSGEHPGEALRYFDQAIRGGLPPVDIAADRGLAYDLTGEQERAQRDYRLALHQPGSGGDEDETRRRYALSLGISGKRDEALTQIDALLRRSDRGAWRARAFILAMGGDVPGAERIANSMMPPGMASGLAPFFARLSQLGAVDRAFAVHFGEVSATATRLADARMAPPLGVLGPDPYAPVQVAAITPDSGRDRKRDDRRRGRGRDQGAAIAAAPVQAPPAALLPPVATASSVAPPPRLAAARVPTVAPATTVPPLVQSRFVAAAAPPPVITPAAVVASARPLSVASGATPTAVAPAGIGVPAAPSATAAAIVPAATIPVAPATSAPIVTAAVTPTPAPAAIVPVTAAAPAPSSGLLSPSAAPALATSGATTPVVANVPPAVTAVAATSPAAAAPVAVASAPPRLSEDGILARIIAGIAVPGSELGVAPVPEARQPAAAATVASSQTLDDAAAAAERNAAADEANRQRAEERRLAARKAAEAKRAGDAREAKRLADAKAAADLKTATTTVDDTRSPRRRGAKDDATAPRGKKGRDADVAAEAAPAKGRKPATTGKVRTDADDATTASQVWVQVAGGATEADLAKAWSAAQAKASALAGRKGYTTPLRATNRVVTGPFKSEEEAQALVNKLAGQGVSAFTFTSAKGQKVTRVGTASAKAKAAADAPARRKADAASDKAPTATAAKKPAKKK